jgi:hypothetical protein
MNKFRIIFNGRMKNAIGAFYKFKSEVMAHNTDEAIEKLYERYDHIRVITITKVKEL